MNTLKNKNEEYNGYRRTLKFLGMFGGAQGLSMFLNLVRNKFASVLLGASGQSIIGIFNRTIQMFSECTNLSLSFSAIRNMSDVYENGDDASVDNCVRVIRSVAVFTGIAGMLLMFLFAPLINEWIMEGGDYYLLRFMLLSPVVFFMAVSGGELAVLRGIKQFSKVAVYNFATALISAVVSVTFYFVMGIAGIFPALFLVAFFQMITLLYLSLPHFSYRIKPFTLKLLKEAGDMVKLGAGYIYASILTTCVMWLICSLLSNIGDGTTVGIFNAGFAMIYLLPGVMFASMDSEYFPRLSGCIREHAVRDKIINEQVEVHILMQSPLLIALVMGLPILVPLLYDTEFVSAVAMAQVAMFGMFMRTMSYPVSFLSLSNSDTKIFLFLESAYNIMLLLFVTIGYSMYGMIGTGFAIAAVHTLDFILIYSIAVLKYKFRFSRNIFICFIIQMPLFILSILVSLLLQNGVWYWVAGMAISLISFAVSVFMLQKQSGLFNAVLKRLHIKKR